MATLHRFITQPPWPVTCADCGNTRFAGVLHRDYDIGVRWVIHDQRAIEIVRTGRPAQRLTSNVLLRRDPVGWVVDLRGLALVVAAHHHTRGQAYDVGDPTWIKVVLLTLHDEWDPRIPSAVTDAARLILGQD